MLSVPANLVSFGPSNVARNYPAKRPWNLDNLIPTFRTDISHWKFVAGEL